MMSEFFHLYVRYLNTQIVYFLDDLKKKMVMNLGEREREKKIRNTTIAYILLNYLP